MPPCSTRSSVSSMNSMSSMSSTSLPQQYNPNNNLNHALAVVTNQLEREQRKHDQEATRKLTLLRQRKISAVLKVNNFWEYVTANILDFIIFQLKHTFMESNHCRNGLNGGKNTNFCLRFLTFYIWKSTRAQFLKTNHRNLLKHTIIKSS